VLGFVNEIPRAALYLFTRTREFEEQRMRGLVLLLRDDAAGSSARGRTALLVERQVPTSGDLNWNESLRSPLFDVAPLEKRAFLVRALPGASTARAPRMSWRAGDSRTGSRSGVWVDEDGVPAAVFDLATEFAWLFGDRVKRVWLESDIERIASAQVMADVPGLPGNPGPEFRPGGIGFRVDTGELARPIHGEARLTLAVLDLSNHRYMEVQAPAGEFQGGEILFPFPEGFPVDATHHGPHFAWSLEWRVGEACIARSFGELDS
jgi:hypothetical protein